MNRRVLLTAAFGLLWLAAVPNPCSAQRTAEPRSAAPKPAVVSRVNEPLSIEEPAPAAESVAPNLGPRIDPSDVLSRVQAFLLFGAVSLAPVALLMITPFVRIHIVLILLRQALGSPQVPGNQVLMALALLLSALVMRPVAERVYAESIEPYMAGKAAPGEALQAGAEPVKAFMVDQIVRTNHQEYLTTLHERAEANSPTVSHPESAEDFSIGVVAPAYILSELTTALKIGFLLYLPFLIIDLVVSAALAAMGLFMLPPTLVSTPAKLIVFVLADGWLLVADMLLAGLTV